MSQESSPEIAKLKPFLVLAKEYESFFPVCSFYLRQYCSNKLMELYKKAKSEGKDDPVIKQTLNAWIGEIEQMKQKYADKITEKAENLKEIESFTLNVFIKADDDEREGKYSVETIRAFQACSKLFDVLNYLGVPSEDLATKKKYSMAKAIEIHKKLKNPELYAPKSTENIDEENKAIDEAFKHNTVNPSQEIKSSMAIMNKSIKNQVFPAEGQSLDQESVDRMLAFIQKNKPLFSSLGYTEEEKSPIKPSNYQINAPQNNIKPSNYSPTKGNMNNKGAEGGLKPQVQGKPRELMSTIANQKMSQAAIKDRVQKECQSAITDIVSNRLPQARNDLENALSFLRQLNK